MNLFIVKDKKTGKFLPPIRGGKSSTAQGLADRPRTFTTRYAAESAARWWAQGMHSRQQDSGGYPEDEVYDSVWPVKGRNLSSLRVHKMHCVILTGEQVRAIPPQARLGDAIAEADQRVVAVHVKDAGVGRDA